MFAENTVGLFAAGPALGGEMGSVERKEDAGTSAGEAKVGVVVETEKGSELIQKLSYDGLSLDAKEVVDKLRSLAKDGNLPSLKALMEYAGEYGRRVGAPVSTESLGQLLKRALEEEAGAESGGA